MRIAAIKLINHSGLDWIEVDNLSDIVVFAGPNGVGKTRILRALVEFFRHPRVQPNIQLQVHATSDEERRIWKKSVLDTTDKGDSLLLQRLLQRPQRLNQYKSTVLNFESDRTVTTINQMGFSWNIPDPYEQDVDWDRGYRLLRDRFHDVQHNLFKLVETHRRKISEKAMRLRSEGHEKMDLDFLDPMARFKEAFYQLLGPKKLVSVDPESQSILFELDGETRPITDLSSGEREVVNIVFDFLLNNPSDCVVLFDEPELHLHPELSYKLLQALSAIGQANQFFFSTHSPEIISASIENSVVFVTPKKPDKSNQALSVARDDATHHALNLLGQSIGIISLGKRLLLIEGDEASLDKQTYGAILKNEFPELVLVPVGGKSTLVSFAQIKDSVLNRTIWGVEFFMLCDRDAVQGIGEKSFASSSSSQLRALPRYHLENYFLEEAVLAQVFSQMENATSTWLTDERKIEAKLRELATATIPYAVALKVAAFVRESVGNIDVMPKGPWLAVDDLVRAIDQKCVSETSRVSGGLDRASIESLCRGEYQRLSDLITSESGDWKRDIPGRTVLNRFASAAELKVGRLKTMYLRASSEAATDPFLEIRELFRGFRSTSVLTTTGPTSG